MTERNLEHLRSLDEYRADLIGFAFPPVQLPNGGSVALVDYSGSDAAIVQAARVSYATGTRQVRDGVGLIRYLMRNRHMSPFEMATAKFRLTMPIFLARQWVRHRTGSMNEESARYSEVTEAFWTPQPSDLRAQGSGKNKQVSEGWLSNPSSAAATIAEAQQAAYAAYTKLLALGVGREQARAVLPVSTMTNFYWSMNLRNWLHLIGLRADSHAQAEIRGYARACLDILQDLFPATVAAWVEFEQSAVRLSGTEATELRAYLAELRAKRVEGWPHHEPDIVGRLCDT